MLRGALWFLGAVVGLSIPLGILSERSHFCQLPFGLTKPVIAIELVENKSQVDGIVCAGEPRERENRLRLRWHTWIDMVLFIPAYAGLYFCLARLSEGDLPLPARATIVLIAVAALADYGEDAGILSALGAGERLYWTRSFALVKWICVFGSTAALAPWWLTRLPWADKLAGLVLGLGGLWGLGASIAANERQMELASTLPAVALAPIAWRLWRQRRGEVRLTSAP